MDGELERRSRERMEQSRIINKGKLAGCSSVIRDQTAVDFNVCYEFKLWACSKSFKYECKMLAVSFLTWDSYDSPWLNDNNCNSFGRGWWLYGNNYYSCEKNDCSFLFKSNCLWKWLQKENDLNEEWLSQIKVVVLLLLLNECTWPFTKNKLCKSP